MTATADATSSSTPTVNVTPSGTPENPSFLLEFSGLKGAKGDQGIQGETGQTGATPNITASATVTNTTGTPSVQVEQTGTSENPAIAFHFDNIKGATGEQGPAGRDGAGSVTYDAATETLIFHDLTT